jgi:trans-AT polyketide synthase, acyltransferase and oxidoreductase domains
MSQRIVFMFAGQGSQYHHMGGWLYRHHKVFRETLQDLDSVVARVRGDSVLARMYPPDRRPDHPFDEFRYTQPSIFMIEYAMARTLLAEGVRPDLVLGASLGEVAAAVVAGAADPHECLELLLRQVDLFEATAPSGGMLAVLGGPECYDRPDGLFRDTDLAAVNSRSNFVVAAAPGTLDRVERQLVAEGVLCQRLPVRYAFHSRHIDAVQPGFRALVAGLTPARPQLPLLSATTGGEVDRVDADHLWQVLRHPFDLDRVLDRLLEQDRYLCLDLGPAGSLANLVRSRLPAGAASTALALMSPFAPDGSRLLDGALAAARVARPAPLADAAGGPTGGTTREARPMTTSRVYLFPGQGSQVKGMGKDLFDRFGELTARAADILGYSIRTLCVDDPDRKLRYTEYTQPALYVVSALSYLDTLQRGERLPDVVLGHSLGEYVALFAAGVFDFETGLRLVQRRGELMSQAGGGTMAAVSVLTAETVREILTDNGFDEIDVANFNAPTQTVIAGPRDAITRALPVFTAAGARCAPLNVSAPFHSRYMAEAGGAFGSFLDGFVFAPPKIPVIANVDARPYEAGDVADRLRRQITSPVRWTDSLRYVLGRGEIEARELGPGTVLTKLLDRIRAEPAPPAPAESPSPSPSLAPVPAPVRASGAAVVEPDGRHLGSAAFRAAYGVEFAYVAGGMHGGIGSVDLVARMARAGMLSFLGTAGLPPGQVAEALGRLSTELPGGAPYGVNLTYEPYGAGREDELVDLLLASDVRCLEVGTYVTVTPALVRYRLRGAHRSTDDRVVVPRRLLAKVSRPDVAEQFLSPPPGDIVTRLREQGAITDAEAAVAALVPMADDLCALGDTGGYTEMGVLPAVLPSILRLRDEVARRQPAAAAVRVGAGGGIGTPEAAAAAFVLGADFVLTGSVNLATAESGLCERVKDLLAGVDVQDTAYAPFGDLFELGGRARVVKKGVLFHARANRLYDIWRAHDDWRQVGVDTRRQVEQRWLRASFDDVYTKLRQDLPAGDPEPDAKRAMALVFRWYCAQARRAAVDGDPAYEVDWEVCCGPALGAANRWLRGTPLAAWRDRHTDEVGRRLMNEAALVASGGVTAGRSAHPALPPGTA